MSEPLEVLVGELLRKRGLQLALAESCTGGLVSHLVTNMPGSSDYYKGGVNAYSNEAKVKLLGVKPATLERFGAVSGETVLEMACGARMAFGADVAISVSGIAGPGGGTAEKPVGTVWIGVSTTDGEAAYHYHLKGNRVAVKEQSAQEALKLLVEYLQQENGEEHKLD